jgi:hypothetical protein
MNKSSSSLLIGVITIVLGAVFLLSPWFIAWFIQIPSSSFLGVFFFYFLLAGFTFMITGLLLLFDYAILKRLIAEAKELVKT